MSNEDLETVKGLFSAFESGNPQELRAMLPAAVEQLCDPEIEFVETPERVDARTFHGHQGVLEAFNRWLDQWDRYNAAPESFEDHGDDIFVVAREEGRGHSGATASARLYLIFSFRNGKVRRYREFYDEQAARAALDG
jgi:ketosteroid isomerase-like protein